VLMVCVGFILLSFPFLQFCFEMLSRLSVNLPARRGCASLDGDYVLTSVPSTSGQRVSKSLSRWSPRSNRALIRC
jgi:hypothetical protein